MRSAGRSPRGCARRSPHLAADRPSQLACGVQDDGASAAAPAPSQLVSRQVHEAGVRSVDPDVTVDATYVGESGTATSQTLNRVNTAADVLYQRGADIVSRPPVPPASGSLRPPSTAP